MKRVVRPLRVIPSVRSSLGVDSQGGVGEDGDVRPRLPHVVAKARIDGRIHPMADIGGAADKAKDYAKDNPEKVDQGKDKAKDALGGQKDDDKK